MTFLALHGTSWGLVASLMLDYLIDSRSRPSHAREYSSLIFTQVQQKTRAPLSICVAGNMNKRTILAGKIAGNVNKRTPQNMNKRTIVAGNMNKRTPQKM